MAVALLALFLALGGNVVAYGLGRNSIHSRDIAPEIDTIINAVRRLGIEFVLDVAPADRKPALVTARAQRDGAIAHDDVSVVAASSV